MSALAFVAALAVPACGVRVSEPKPPAEPTKVYTFPIELPNSTEICVVAHRPQLSVGCMTLGRLRRMAFDLEAD